jgi:hypothetical protein
MLVAPHKIAVPKLLTIMVGASMSRFLPWSRIEGGARIVLRQRDFFSGTHM